MTRTHKILEINYRLKNKSVKNAPVFYNCCETRKDWQIGYNGGIIDVHINE